MRATSNTANQANSRNFKNVTEHPAIQIGTIYCTTYGYSMTLVSFHQVVRRSGNTIYTRELNTSTNGDKKSGYQAGYKSAIPNSFRTTRENRSRIKDEKFAKIDGQYGMVWNGEPQWFDTMD